MSCHKAFARRGCLDMAAAMVSAHTWRTSGWAEGAEVLGFRGNRTRLGCPFSVVLRCPVVVQETCLGAEHDCEHESHEQASALSTCWDSDGFTTESSSRQLIPPVAR